MENRFEVISNLERLLDSTEYLNGIRLQYGTVEHGQDRQPYDSWQNYAVRNFVPLTEHTYEEYILATYNNSKIVINITADSGKSIITDVVRALYDYF